MKNPYLKVLTLIVMAVIALSMFPTVHSQQQTTGYTVSFLLQNEVDGDQTYELNVTIPQALYMYYLLQSHVTYAEADLAKFVTPHTLKPIADSLWQIYNNTEDFTNGVLMLVHQLDYREIVPGKYPIETLVNGYGDCDLYAFIASSILEAGGIDSVLLYYREKLHMEIGVNLGSAPTKARVETFKVTHDNTDYYIGECTGGKWRTGWRIGETPTAYQNISARVITLEKMEQSSFAQVSVTLRELDPSTVNLQASPSLMLENTPISINGQIQPHASGENVTLKAQINNGGWTTLGTVLTDTDGRFSYSWSPETVGTLAVQASWVGNRQLNGVASPEISLTVLPLIIVVEAVVLSLAVVIALVAFVKIRRKKGVSITGPLNPDSSLPQNPP